MVDDWIIILRFHRNISSVRCGTCFEVNECLPVCALVERPAIDCLLDHIWSQEARKPAIDKLIEEYLGRIGSPLIYYPSANTAPLMSMRIPTVSIFHSFCLAVGGENETKKHPRSSTQQTQTPSRAIQHYQSAPSFSHTPVTSDNDATHCCQKNYEFQQTASTPILRCGN